MPRLAAGVLVIALVATACSVEPIEDPGIGAGGLTSMVYAADGTVLTEWHAGEDRVLVSYEELPRHLIDTVVAVEDQRFWMHTGVDLQAIARAAEANFEAGEIVQGGSTITQQYVKNVILDPEVTFDRKIEEAGLALRVEESLTKEEILERYLNTIYFGRGAYGIGAASRRYFDKHPSELTLAESALLAGIIIAPARLDPYLNANAALSRRRTVLEKTAELGWITTEAAEAADSEPLLLAPAPAVGERSRAAYFTEEVKQLLLSEPALGADDAKRFDTIFRGGLRIYTTLDPAVQLSAEAALASVLPSAGPAGALVAIDPRNGHVLAIVGGRDYYDPDDPIAKFNLATQGRRQPGSAFKPFTLAAALEAGLRLEDVFAGGPITWVPTPGGAWTVTNINGFNFPELSLREATVFSVNTVYAELINVVGPQQVARLVSEAGIEGLDPVHSLALGTEEVTVLELASAYGTFAAGGIHVDPVLVTRVEDADGNVLYQQTPSVTNVVDAGIADLVTETLTEVVRRGTGQQAKIGRPIAGKTGTTEGNHDAWFVGYTPELVAAVWVGFPEGNRALRSPDTPFTITGGTWPAQIWARFAVGALSGIPYGELATGSAAEAITVEIDLSTGFLAGPLCPRNQVATLHLDPDAVPTVVCPIHNPAGIEVLETGIVPNLVDMAFDDAISLLEAAGYEATLSWVAPADVPSSSVLSQTPSAGAEAAPGMSVALTISGPEPGTAVPTLLGLDEDEARRRLDLGGLEAEFVLQAETDPEDAARRAGIVWAQLPAGDAPIDGPITVWVNPLVEVDGDTAAP